MEPVEFRTPGDVEGFQYHIKVAAGEGKKAISHISHNTKEFVTQVLNRPKTEQVLEQAQKLYVFLVAVVKDAKEVIITKYHPRLLLKRLNKFVGKRITKRDIFFGCVGVLFGTIVGFTVAYVLSGKPEVFHCMQAIQCLNYSGIDGVAVLEDALTPSRCDKNEVLVNVKSASINQIDARICNGYGSLLRNILSRYFKYCRGELPVTLGRDCAGIVVDIGQNVTRLEVGDEVWLTAPFWAPGTLSQYVLAAQSRVSRKPKSLNFEGACSLPYSGSLALSALEELNINSQNAKTKSVLIIGGCSAVGCVLLQILKTWGAKITATSNHRAVPVIKALGVEDIIVLAAPLSKNITSSKTDDSSYVLRKELDIREPFDVIICTTRCTLQLRELNKFCTDKGRVLYTCPQPLKSDSYGFLFAGLYSLHIRFRCFLQRIFCSNLSNFGETHMCHTMLDKLADLVDNGKVRSVVDKVYQPYDIEEALTHIKSPESIGSTVITFR